MASQRSPPAMSHAVPHAAGAPIAVVPSVAVASHGGTASSCAAAVPAFAAGAASTAAGAWDGGASSAEPKTKKKTPPSVAPAKAKTKRAKISDAVKEKMAAEASHAAATVSAANRRTLVSQIPYVFHEVAANTVWPDMGILVTFIFPFTTDSTWRLRQQLRVRLYACPPVDSDKEDDDGDEEANDKSAAGFGRRSTLIYGELDEDNVVKKPVDITYNVVAWLLPKPASTIRNEDRISVPQETAIATTDTMWRTFVTATSDMDRRLLDDEPVKMRIIKTAPPSDWRFDTTFVTPLIIDSSSRCVSMSAVGFSVGWPVISDVDGMDVAIKM